VVDILVDLRSVDFGVKSLNEFMVGADFFDATKFPDSRYHGTLAGFVNGVPGKSYGFSMQVTLRIQAEAHKND
jgi:polyisoprenoid-binding protein YceI